MIWIKEMRREDILVRVEGWELHCFNLQEPRGNGFLAGQGINIKYLDWDEAGSSLTQRERKVVRLAFIGLVAFIGRVDRKTWTQGRLVELAFQTLK